MKASTLLRWFFNKLSFVTVIIVACLAWWIAALKYQKEYKTIETALITNALELNNGSPLSKISDPGLNYSVIDFSGTIIADKKFGSLSSISDSEYFQKAKSGETIIRSATFEGIDKVECWSTITYKGSKHVLVLRKAVNYSRGSYFLLYLLIFAVMATAVLILYAVIITNPLKDSLTYLTSEIKNLEKEKYEKKLPSIDSKEFSQLYEAYNDLSSHIQNELSSLRTDVNQWEVFFSTMPRGLIAIDSERVIHNCNANALDLLDVKEKEMKEVPGQSVMAVFRNADLNRITSDFFESENFLEEYEFELVANNIIETIKIICVELEMTEKEDVDKGAIVIIENITSLRHLENMRKDFVSNVSHELKTPISIIAGFTETIKECLNDPESALRFIEIIDKNTARLTLIIDDLLNLSKLEQNEALIRKDFEDRNLTETVRSAVDVCSHEAGKKSIVLVLELEDSKLYETETMPANHRLLEQAVRNLIENAIRYSPNGSQIKITSKKVENEIEISIIDSGPGIPKEHHDKIFGRFYRVDKSRDRQTGGSGLGLAIVKHIARIHNGLVKLESETGKGSTFTLVLPYNTKVAASPGLAVH